MKAEFSTRPGLLPPTLLAKDTLEQTSGLTRPHSASLLEARAFADATQVGDDRCIERSEDALEAVAGGVHRAMTNAPIQRLSAKRWVVLKRLPPAQARSYFRAAMENS